MCVRGYWRLCARVRVWICVYVIGCVPVCVRIEVLCACVCVYLCVRIGNAVSACAWSTDWLHPARSAPACPSAAGMRRWCRWLEGLCTVLNRIVDAHEKRGVRHTATALWRTRVLQAGWTGRSEECARAGTLDQQKATVERMSKEIGVLADLVEENEAKGRVGQVLAHKRGLRGLRAHTRTHGHTHTHTHTHPHTHTHTDTNAYAEPPVPTHAHPRRSHESIDQRPGEFRTASAEIADKIRRLVEVLQSGLQVSKYLY